MRALAFVAAALSLSACQTGEDAFSRPRSIALEMDYETGGAPTVGATGFTVFEDNVVALFPDLPDGLTVPAGVDQMQDVGPLDGDTYTVNAILGFANAHRNGHSNGSAHQYYVLYLAGTYQDSSGPRDDVLGLTIGTTGILAIFTPVVDNAAFFPGVRAFVGQTVLIHEFGHAIGLVDNGIPMVTDHHDGAHAAHCSNPNCVMYWANEGLADIATFTMNRMSTGSDVLFDTNCLNDAHAHYGP